MFLGPFPFTSKFVHGKSYFSLRGCRLVAWLLCGTIIRCWKEFHRTSYSWVYYTEYVPNPATAKSVKRVLATLETTTLPFRRKGQQIHNTHTAFSVSFSLLRIFIHSGTTFLIKLRPQLLINLLSQKEKFSDVCWIIPSCGMTEESSTAAASREKGEQVDDNNNKNFNTST